MAMEILRVMDVSRYTDEPELVC